MLRKKTKKSSDSLQIVRNPDYTISVIDNAGRVLIFRDICGGDLELLESILNPESLEDGTKILINLDNMIAILNIISKQDMDFVNMSRRIIFNVFSLVR